MKILKFFTILLILQVTLIACDRVYVAPPLTEPVYSGKLDNISIRELKERYASLKDPEIIADDLIIKAVVVGNDESGNIYKQLYLEDYSGGINIGVDQNSMYASFQVGQEVFIQLKDLFVVRYGGELQIGMDKTNANRISWNMFNQKAFVHSWPNMEKAKPSLVKINELKDDMVNRLIEIQDIWFINAGKNAFTTNDATTNERIKDAAGNQIDIRTSNFSTFAKDLLPVGKGSIVGVLGRFNGSWQILLRTKNDVKSFDGQPLQEVKPQAGVFFSETFGTGYYPSGNRPKINAFTEYDMKAPIKYTDASGNADIRSIAGDHAAHIWLPANRETTIEISGINSKNKGDVTLSYQLTANLFDAGSVANLNQIQLKLNGTLVTIPSHALSNAAGDNGKFYTVTIPNIPQDDNLIISFVSSASLNTIGFRLDNIKLVGGSTKGDEVIYITAAKKH